MRTEERAFRWQSRADALIPGAAIAAVIGVLLQTVARNPWKAVGVGLVALSWLVLTGQAAMMLVVAPRPLRWLRGHAFDVSLIVFTCPLWVLVARNLVLLELLPALTVLELTKLAKLAKAARAVRTRPGTGPGGRLLATAVVMSAVAVGVLVVLR